MLAVKDLLINLVLCGILLALSRFLWNYLQSPLKSFPGPWAASFTNLWRLQDVFKGRCHITHLDLHRRLGSVVRMGPHVLSLSDPELVKHVYTTRNPWSKSDMYNVNDVIVSGVRLKNLFSHQDETWHSMFIRPIKGLYSMTKVQDFEPGVDKIINLFTEKMRERFVNTGKPCKISEYINYFAWDVMSQVTFSEDLGMLVAGSDLHKVLDTSSKCLDYFASICQIPKLDFLLDKNPIYRLGPPGFGWATAFCLERYQRRVAEGQPMVNEVDFMNKFIEAKSKNPNIVNDDVIIMYLLSNVVAGSDTTASTICSAVYHILKHPAVCRKLCEELRSADLSVPAQWKEIHNLRYLEAVMRESMRINPGVGLLVERVVPKGGFTLPDGRFVAEDTIVGMNPWVINRDSTVFGAETDSFNPDRWLRTDKDKESEADYQTRLSKMKGADFTFGAGSRACIGQYLSQLEAYKFIATVFTQFDMKLPSLDHEWKVVNSWFVRQSNVPVLIEAVS